MCVWEGGGGSVVTLATTALRAWLALRPTPSCSLAHLLPCPSTNTREHPHTRTRTHTKALLACLVGADDCGCAHCFCCAEVAHQVVVRQHLAHRVGQREGDREREALGHRHHLVEWGGWEAGKGVGEWVGKM